jgi:hypothetical protein
MDLALFASLTVVGVLVVLYALTIHWALAMVAAAVLISFGMWAASGKLIKKNAGGIK